MGNNKKKDSKSVSLKKETFLQLNTQLASSLAWLKEVVGEKKFESRIKKAAKLLSEGIKEKAAKKIKMVKKNPDKKKTAATEHAPENV